MSKGETWKKWERENTTTLNLRLHHTHDADILDAVKKALDSGEESRGAVLKRWIRAGMELDKQANK